MKKLLFASLLGFGLFCSCTHKLDVAPETPSFNGDYTIPIETALNSLEGFLASYGDKLTKGSLKPEIDNWFPISNGVATKGIKPPQLIYAVNFKDKNGYALISADRRISTDVIAIIDSGEVTDKDFYPVDKNMVVSDDDDLSPAEFKAMVDSGVLAMNFVPINRECLKFAEAEVRNYSLTLDENINTGNVNTGTVVETHWETIKTVPMMLNTVWTQIGDQNVFNKYCPTVGVSKKELAPAGCVCIATAQIIAYHEFPKPLRCNNIDIDYSIIKSFYRLDEGRIKTGIPKSSKENKAMMSNFIFDISKSCKTKYGKIFGNSWGFAWPWNARKCLEKYGYKDVRLNWGYDEGKVINSLDKGCPVFISAISKVINGHAWVIDGYIKRDKKTSTGDVVKSQTLVHCNWGWNGLCNGYFTSGVFKTNSAEISDNLGTITNEERYWSSFNFISYEKPY